MTPRLLGRLARAGLVVGFCLMATPTAAQMVYDMSAYADGAPDGYDGNGNAELDYWGSGYDNSSGGGGGCYHEYSFYLEVRRQPGQEIEAQVYGATEGSGSKWVTPATYDIEVMFGVWCSCFMNWVGSAGAQQSVPVPPPVPTISGANELWWFNGMNPSGYSTSIMLTSAGGASTQWSVTAGGSLVSLSTTQGTSVTISSTGASTAGNDVRITATNSGGTDDHDLTVRSPHRLEAGTIVTNCPDATWGYETFLTYTIRDQFGSTMPNGAALSEDWTSGVTNHWPGTNWRRGSPGGITLPGSTFSDHIQGEHVNLPPTPQPQCGSLTQVQSWGQEWRVGSTTPGQGQRVQTNTLTKRRGEAAHQSVMSPP